MHDRILIVDFGSQVTQLIARRVREQGVYCEIAPFQKARGAFAEMKPRAVILSGGPASVLDRDAPLPPAEFYRTGVPVLGICYGDRVTRLPAGFRAVGTSPNAPIAAIADEQRKFYATQFHLEVVHTPHGAALLRNFVRNIAGCPGDWTMRAFRDEAIEKIRRQVGQGRVICGLSGGVDSAVAAVLIHEAIGERLTCVFVDHGLLRQGEAAGGVSLFRDSYNIPLLHVAAEELFLGALEGITEPELKRKTIGRVFIEVFEAEAKKADGAEFLAQGTLYPDVIESTSFAGGPSATIK